MTQQDLGTINVAVTLISEQEKIIRYLDEKCKIFDRLSDIINQEVTFLSEYRTRLISDVVTGKVDMREVKPNYA
jgi:type I restriction enzyme S subunit